MRWSGATLILLLISCQTGREDDVLQVSGPSEIWTEADVQLLVMECVETEELEAAQRLLMAWIDLPRDYPQLFEDEIPLEEAPAPDRCRWLRLDQSIQVPGSAETPVGNLVLCRLDGPSLHLRNFDRSADRTGEERIIRLEVHGNRRIAWRDLSQLAVGSYLLFVERETVRMVARVEETLGSYVEARGVSPEEERFLLRERDLRRP